MRERLANNSETTQHTSLCIWDDLAKIWLIVFLFTILSISQFRLFFSQFWIYILQWTKFRESDNSQFISCNSDFFSSAFWVKFTFHNCNFYYLSIQTFFLAIARSNIIIQTFPLRIASYKHLAVIFRTCLYLTILFISCNSMLMLMSEFI